MHNNKVVNIIGWIIAILSTALYTLTQYPTISFWDGAEFVATSSTLQIPHPPGAPFFQLLGSIIPLTYLMPIFSGLSVMMLYHISVYTLSRFSQMRPGIIASSTIGALTFAVLDSQWFCANETDVYPLSLLLSLVAIYLTIKWTKTHIVNYLILTCLLLGLSLCVHQLTLLSLPAICLIIYFDKRKTTFKGAMLYLLLSLLLIFFIQFALPTFLIWIFSSHSIIKIIIFLFFIAFLIFISYKKSKPILLYSTLGLIFILIGLSTYIIIPIRANSGVPINQYNPKDVKQFANYYNRENFTKPPLIYGQYFTALPPENFEITENGQLKPIFAKEQKTIFPRMWNYESISYENGYIEWVGQPEETVIINGEERPKPSFKQNLQFFFSYQLNYMYFRYLLNNFSGKVNDVQGYGDYKNSQWTTGIKYVENKMNINSQTINPQAKKGHNLYYAIPLLLVIIGLFYHLRKDSKFFLVNFVLFFFTSIALVLYLNQAAYQPRERDYVFLLSFASLSLWLTIGIYSISQTIANIIRLRRPIYVTPLFIALPIYVGIENFDDHNHAGQYTARNFAVSMLESCDKNAILFVNGDNDTFPLWYAQAVEGIRTDIRVINLQLLNDDSNIKQIYQAQYESAPIETTLTPKQYENQYTYNQIYPSFDREHLSKVIKDSYTLTDTLFGTTLHILNTNKYYLKKDNDSIYWQYNALEIGKSTLVALDIIATNIEKRPIYFSSYSIDDFYGLENYLSLEGFAYKLEGKPTAKQEIIALKAGGINEDKMFENFIHKFQWKNFNKPNVYYNETEREFVKLFYDNTICLAYKLLQNNKADKALIVCNTLTENLPFSQHYYPEAAADLAIIYSLLGREDKSEEYIHLSTKQFSQIMQQYFALNTSQQAQDRIQIQKLENTWYRLLLQSQDWGLEHIRITLADKYFTMINQYLQITLRQFEKMTENPDFYYQEIQNIVTQLQNIYTLAQDYEENLTPIPEKLMEYFQESKK
ncbi:MAG: DUF2723 domain-containing protein [Bacteroidales bacterium]|nr:DUF2723 domain-containing protein [Bacteroidales bacterium]MBQ5873626.1 DUF2723 domain-containing protein [Bacteroidales bacterium]